MIMMTIFQILVVPLPEVHNFVEKSKNLNQKSHKLFLKNSMNNSNVDLELPKRSKVIEHHLL
jgi:hypothetical protein